jgi:hypothetical protein
MSAQGTAPASKGGVWLLLPPLLGVHDLLPLARAYFDKCCVRHSAPRASELAQELGLSRARLSERFTADYAIRWLLKACSPARFFRVKLQWTTPGYGGVHVCRGSSCSAIT